VEYKKILSIIENSYKRILGSNLIGIYVHGSIAFGCFNWNKSDIDFIVVTGDVPSQEQKENLIQVLLDLTKCSPPKGLEMSVVLEKHCLNFVYPTPYELHFSNMHDQKYLNDLSGTCKAMQGTDKDLVAHFTVIKNTGIVLCGKPIEDVFGDIPKEYYLDSIKYDVKDSLENLEKYPVDVILNLCRVLAYIRHDLVISKAAGGLWGIKNLNPKYTGLIQKTLESYHSEEKMEIDSESAKAFCHYMLDQIFN
jgi:predicted nucleotidyltransferase